MPEVLSAEILERDKDDKSLIVLKNNRNTLKGNETILKKKLKEEKFARAYVKYNCNGRKAMSEVSPGSTEHYWTCKAGEYLKRPSVRKRIIEIMLPEDKDLNIIQDALAAERPSSISWKDLLQFVKTSLELKGHFNKGQFNEKVNIALFVKE